MKREIYDLEIKALNDAIAELREKKRRIQAIYQGSNEYQELKGKLVVLVNKNGDKPYPPFYFHGLRCSGEFVYVVGNMRKKDGTEGLRKTEYWFKDTDQLKEVK